MDSGSNTHSERHEDQKPYTDRDNDKLLLGRDPSLVKREWTSSNLSTYSQGNRSRVIFSQSFFALYNITTRFRECLKDKKVCLLPM